MTRYAEWRYMPNGRVRHALVQAGDSGALCGASMLPASEWRGTGTQEEYETVEQLRPCRRCLWLLEHR